MDIPADIKKTVEELFEPFSYLVDGPSEEMIATLLLAERQACARIAKNLVGDLEDEGLNVSAEILADRHCPVAKSKYEPQ